MIEDNVFREKLNHFDFERIPERVVHARGAGAHGYFQVLNQAPLLGLHLISFGQGISSINQPLSIDTVLCRLV